MVEKCPLGSACRHAHGVSELQVRAYRRADMEAKALGNTTSTSSASATNRVKRRDSICNSGRHGAALCKLTSQLLRRKSWAQESASTANTNVSFLKTPLACTMKAQECRKAVDCLSDCPTVDTTGDDECAADLKCVSVTSMPTGSTASTTGSTVVTAGIAPGDVSRAPLNENSTANEADVEGDVEGDDSMADKPKRRRRRGHRGRGLAKKAAAAAALAAKASAEGCNDDESSEGRPGSVDPEGPSREVDDCVFAHAAGLLEMPAVFRKQDLAQGIAIEPPPRAPPGFGGVNFLSLMGRAMSSLSEVDGCGKSNLGGRESLLSSTDSVGTRVLGSGGTARRQFPSGKNVSPYDLSAIKNPLNIVPANEISRDLYYYASVPTTPSYSPLYSPTISVVGTPTNRAGSTNKADADSGISMRKLYEALHNYIDISQQYPAYSAYQSAGSSAPPHPAAAGLVSAACTDASAPIGSEERRD
eukprot:Filipodium_phascolosomae@DN1631_c0_g1_i1.p1